MCLKILVYNSKTITLRRTRAQTSETKGGNELSSNNELATEDIT
jgi:hypothetical protein